MCYVTNSTQSLRAADFQNLDETNKYSVLVSGGCHTVPLERSYYISEQWINAPNGGVAFVGAAADFRATPSFSYNLNFYNSLYASNTHTIGWANIYTANNSVSPDYLHKIVNILGDPELSVYTDEPVNISVAHNNTITTGVSDFDVNVSGFSNGELVKICLYKEEEVLAFSETETGSTSFNITPDTPGEMILTVTCHNSEPYETSINVTQNPNVHLYKSNVIIIDENSNGIIEPGETVELTIELSNTGMLTASNISGALSTSDENTTITQNTSVYPNILSNQSGNSLNTYSFTIGTEDVFHGKAIPFELEITSAQGTFIESFFLNVKSAKLELGNRVLLVNGIETNTLNPGDAAELFVDIHNFGTITANNVTAVLSATPSYVVTITNGTQNYGDIERMQKVTNVNPFAFNMNNNYEGEELRFKLTISDAFGNTKVINLDLTEEFPEMISGFDFSSGKNYISLLWTEIEDIKGYNIYRCDTETGTFNKLNDFIVSGTPIFTDQDVEGLSEYFYKISVVSISGNERNLNELTAYKAWTSLDIHGGFPIAINADYATKNRTSVAVSDVDGDGTNELFPAMIKHKDGLLMGFYETGQELYNIDGNETTTSGFAKIILPENTNGSTVGGELWSIAAIGDVDNDNHAEVFVTTHGNYYAQKRGYLFGFKTTDEAAPINYPDPLWDGNPIDLGHASCSSPVLADLDGDGYMEIITNQEKQKIRVISRDGTVLWDKEVGTSPWYSYGYTAVADLDNNGEQEIIIGTREPGAVYIFNYDGTDFNGTNPIYTSSSQRFDTNPVIADIDTDGESEIVIVGRSGYNGNLYAFNTDGTFVSGKWDGQINLGFFESDGNVIPQVAIGDLTNDGDLEIAIADKNTLLTD